MEERFVKAECPACGRTVTPHLRGMWDGAFPAIEDDDKTGGHIDIDPEELSLVDYYFICPSCGEIMFDSWGELEVECGYDN